MLKTLNQGLKDTNNHTQELKLTTKEQQKWITNEIGRLNKSAYEDRDSFLAGRRGVHLKDRSEWLDTVRWILSLLLPLLFLNILALRKANILPLAGPIITFESLPRAQALPDVLNNMLGDLNLGTVWFGYKQQIHEYFVMVWWAVLLVIILIMIYKALQPKRLLITQYIGRSMSNMNGDWFVQLVFRRKRTGIFQDDQDEIEIYCPVDEVPEGASNGSLNTNNVILINSHGILHLNRRLLIRFSDIDGMFVKELPFDLDIDYETIVWEIHRDPRLNDEREVYKARVDLKRMYYRRIR